MPDTPGVYFFLDKQKKVLYIGKATELALAACAAIFLPIWHKTRGPLITAMVEKAASA